jgi:hypothetical protein
MTAELVIEHPRAGATYSHDDYGVYSYDEYPPGSVNEGQTRRRFLDAFDTLPEAKAAFPTASYTDGSGYIEQPIPTTAPAWFNPENAGETWADAEAWAYE